jgi:hypothetical protein
MIHYALVCDILDFILQIMSSDLAWILPSIVIYPASVGILILSIHHQTIVYYTLVCDILVFFGWGLDIVCNTCSSIINV